MYGGMMLFKNKYRVEPTRWEQWNYSWPGSYFVTICAKNRRDWFGSITDDTMRLSDIGKIAAECWMDIPDHSPFVELDDFVVMPNHLHGIIHMDDVETQFIASQSNNQETLERDAMNHRTGDAINRRTGDAMNRVSTGNEFGPQKNNLADIIRSYKARVSRNARLNHNENFAWQPRYFDRVIRNEKELHHIQEYIVSNPLRWKYDYENPNYIEPDSKNKLAGDIFTTRHNR